MIHVRTIRLQLVASPDQVLPTLKAYTKAFNLVCSIGWKDSDSNGISLHNKTYKDCKALGLSSQLACSARVKASEALSSVKAKIKKGKKASCPKSVLCPVRLDARSYTPNFRDKTCTIRLVEKRAKFSLKIPKFYEQFLDWRWGSADLIVKKNLVFLHVSMEKESDDPVPSGQFVGIDAGIKRTAVTSTNRFFGGGRLLHVSSRYKNLRRKLQKKGHSGKRHLVRLKGKENRFVRDMLHVVSRRIVDSVDKGTTVVVEDLNGIRDRAKLGLKARSLLNAWAFSKLQSFVKYKAESKGCLFVKVDPRNTSRTCSKCGYVDKKSRKNQSEFECVSCGHRLNADLNGSRNIALRGEMMAAKGSHHGSKSTDLEAP